jgi:hypothetical protein
MAKLGLLLVSCSLFAGVGCAAPVQNGGVVMSPHAEARLGLMCRYRSADPQQLCVVEAADDADDANDEGEAGEEVEGRKKVE